MERSEKLALHSMAIVETILSFDKPVLEVQVYRNLFEYDYTDGEVNALISGLLELGWIKRVGSTGLAATEQAKTRFPKWSEDKPQKPGLALVK